MKLNIPNTIPGIVNLDISHLKPRTSKKKAIKKPIKNTERPKVFNNLMSKISLPIGYLSLNLLKYKNKQLILY